MTEKGWWRYIFQISEEELLKAYETFPEGFEIIEQTSTGLKIAIYTKEDREFPFTIVEKQKVEPKDWKEYYKPIKVGKSIVIVPPWEVANNSFVQKELIVINPGKAFGTGLHESTQLCLELMEELDFKGKKVLDVGSGSGILSIYAAKKGADKVVAVDIDPFAVEETFENAKANKVEEKIEAFQGSAKDVEGTFDVVIANLEIHIFREVLKDIAPKIGGVGIFSGLYRVDELIEFLQMANKLGLKPKRVVEKKDWYSVVIECLM